MAAIRKTLVPSGLAVAMLAAAPAPCALAATVPQAGAAAGAVVYEPAAFPGSNTAEDLLRRIPGVQAILDASGETLPGRGFGSGGAQILLNGRRFPGKSNDIINNLRRIPAANLVRVELVSAASAQVAVQSDGMVVNLVLREGAPIGGTGSWELSGRANDAGWAGLDGLATYSRTFGALTVTGGVERNLWSPAIAAAGSARWTSRTRSEVYYYPGGAIQELRPQAWTRRHRKWTYTAAASYDFASGATLNVNGFYERRGITETDVTRLVRFSPAGDETLRAVETHIRLMQPYWTKELSGEYQTRIGPGAFTGLFIVKRQSNPALDTRDRLEPSRDIEVSQSDAVVSTGEDIVRGVYSLALPAGATLELGAEAARNTLTQRLDVLFDLNNDGKLEPARLPIADPKVKELRGEVFGGVKWKPSGTISLDATAAYEFSKLTTNYPLLPPRQLGFLKPRISLQYRPSRSVQYRLLVERKVSQLDFNNFVPRYNFTDDRVEAGNPGLLPEKTWSYELGFERRLARDGGLIDLRVFYEDTTDAIEKTPLQQGGFLVSASGNIPKATLYGAEARIALRLGFLGLPGAQLNLRGLRQFSRINDPFTGRTRRLFDDRSYAYDISFRHDLRRWGVSYGVNYRNTGRAAINSDLLFSERYTIDPIVDLFIEKAVRGGTTVRLELQNLTHSHERRWRELYQVNQIDGRLRRADFYEERRDIRGVLRLRGKF